MGHGGRGGQRLVNSNVPAHARSQESSPLLRTPAAGGRRRGAFQLWRTAEGAAKRRLEAHLYGPFKTICFTHHGGMRVRGDPDGSHRGLLKRFCTSGPALQTNMALSTLQQLSPGRGRREGFTPEACRRRLLGTNLHVGLHGESKENRAATLQEDRSRRRGSLLRREVDLL